MVPLPKFGYDFYLTLPVNSRHLHFKSRTLEQVYIFQLQMDTKTDTPDEKSLYAQMKALSTKLEFLDITEGYVKDEMANLKREMVSFKITFFFIL